MASGDMKIVKIKLSELTPYKGNAKQHPKEQIEQIKESIQRFKNCDPIAVWGDKNIIVEGHGRYMALKQLGYDEVDCIRLDHLTDEERRAYTLVHNKLTMNSDFDVNTLTSELEDIINIDMTDFGFELEDEDEDNPYSQKVKVPQYEITGAAPSIVELTEEDKTNELEAEINASSVTDEEKKFLLKAAQRHMGFNYKLIAEYYANASEEMQELMEKSALVIIDYDDAIANGYTKMMNKIRGLENIDS